MYPVSLVYFCRIYAKKQRGGGLRKQKAKVFAASLRSFPAIIQAKENWTKVVKKPGQTTTAAAFCFFFPSYLAFKVCIQEKNQEAEEWPTARKTLLYKIL